MQNMNEYKRLVKRTALLQKRAEKIYKRTKYILSQFCEPCESISDLPDTRRGKTVDKMCLSFNNESRTAKSAER